MTSPIACTGGAAVFRCPTKWELWTQVMNLLPRGRAWQTHESVIDVVPGTPSVYGRAEVGATGIGYEAGVERLTVLQQYWAAYAEVLEDLHQRACALIEEMFCTTTRELAGEWGIDYATPGPCEPWPTLCDKVRAQGGATCAYFVDLAATIGYTIACNDRCPSPAIADGSWADAANAAGFIPRQVQITVYADLSPAMSPERSFAADSLVADCTPACPPVPDDLICLIERWKPAHVKAIYEVA